MKKLLAFLLVLVMILSVSLVACNKDTTTTDDDDDDWGNGSETTDNDTNKNNNNNNNNGGGTGGGSNQPAQWRDASGTVYTGLDKVNLRTAPNTTSSTVVDTVPVGTPLARIQTNDTWDKVSYNDQEVYVLCALVSTVSANFTANLYAPEDYVTLTINPEIVAADKGINLRSTPFLPSGTYSRENIVIEALKNSHGGTLTKVGVTTSGNWYVVTYSGTIGDTTYDNKVLYMAASSVSEGHVSDPSRPSGGGSSGGVG